MKTASGYSGTPLAKKLGIREGFAVLLHNQPDHYLDLFPDLPPKLSFPTEPDKETIDFVHIFCTYLSQLKDVVAIYRPVLKKTGLLWVSWPKGSSKIPTDLKRDPVRDYMLSIGLVDTKVAAVDEDWSGLKFVYLIKDR